MKTPAVINLLLCSLPLVSGKQAGKLVEYGFVSPLDTPCETEFHPDQLDVAWVELIASNTILRVNLTTAEQKRFHLNNPAGLPSGMEFMPDDNLWFSEVVGNCMVKLNPKDGSMTEYPFPWTNILPVDALPAGIRVTIDVAGNRDRGAWFTSVGLNAIGRIDIDTFKYSLYPLPNLLSGPLNIQGGPGSTMVFSEILGNRVGIIDVHTKKITEFEIPTPLSLVQGVTTDADGLIWWTGTGAGNFGTIDVKTGKVTEMFIADIRAAGKSTVIENGLPSIGSSGALALPGPIRVGKNGKIYFVEGNLVLLGNRIAEYDPKTGLLKEYVIPSSLSGPCDLNNQHPEAIFFAGFTGGNLGRLNY